jgi:pimeloyl-ACP methyl ester carboxylesterase
MRRSGGPTSGSFLSCEVIGSRRGSQPSIIMIHGFGANTYTWRHVVPHLTREHHLVIPDLKGFGRSPKPLDDAYSAFDQAHLVYDLLRHHDLNSISLVGHSFGGGVALLVALRALAEQTVKVASLVLIDSIAYRQRYPFFISALRTPVIGLAAAHIVPPQLQVWSVLAYAYYDAGKISSADIEAYSAPLKESGGRHALLATAQHIAPPGLDKITPHYKEIDIPVLLVWGCADRIVPVEIGRRLHHDLPRSELHLIARAGHIPHEERPEAAVPIIGDFLDRTARG